MIPIPVISKKVWNYNEEKYMKLKNASYRDKKERNKFFRCLIHTMKKNLFLETEPEIKYENLTISCSIETYNIFNVKSVNYSTCIESKEVGVYDWLDEDFFSISMNGGQALLIGAEDMKNGSYEILISKLLD